MLVYHLAYKEKVIKDYLAGEFEMTGLSFVMGSFLYSIIFKGCKRVGKGLVNYSEKRG